MDKITKFLKRLSPKERERLEKTLTLLLSNKASTLDIKKLKGVDGVYRVRDGDLRVIFHKQGSEINVLEVSRRGEGTYKHY